MLVEVQPGVPVHFVDVGPREGRPIVFLHASGLSHAVWERQVAALCGDFRTVAVDLRGHGLSAAPSEGYEPARVAEDIAGVLDSLDLHDVTLVGWSRGGAIAVKTVSLWPSRIGRLVLVAPSGPFPLTHPENPVRVSSDEQEAIIHAERSKPAEFRQATIATMPKRPYSEALSVSLLTQYLQAPSWATGRAMRAHFDEDYRGDAARVKVPTLVLLGRADSVAPEQRVREYQRLIAGARFEWFEESGHSPNLEEAEKFNLVLRDFIADSVA